jgi:hypothetical protein
MALKAAARMKSDDSYSSLLARGLGITKSGNTDSVSFEKMIDCIAQNLFSATMNNLDRSGIGNKMPIDKVIGGRYRIVRVKLMQVNLGNVP